MTQPAWPAELADEDAKHLAGLSGEERVYCAQDLPLAAVGDLCRGLWHMQGRPVILVTEGPQTQDVLFQDLLTLCAFDELEAVLFPARETLPGRTALPNPDLVGQRLAALLRFMQNPFPNFVVTSVQALLQPTRKPSVLARQQVRLKVGSQYELEPFTLDLEEMGYDYQAEVTGKGQASRRGGILDLWPPSEDWPVRLEFFGDVLDSIRLFDPVEQRSIERVTELNLGPPGEKDENDLAEDLDLFTAYVPSNAAWIWVDPNTIETHATLYRESCGDANQDILEHRTLRERIADTFSGGQLDLGAGNDPGREITLDYEPAEALAMPRGEAVVQDKLLGRREQLFREIHDKSESGIAIHFFFASDGSRERFEETWKSQPLFHKGIQLHTGLLTSGFRAASRGLEVYAEADLFGKPIDTRTHLRARERRRKASSMAGQRVAEWSDLQPGDLVVHIDHGIGKYLGLYEIKFDGELQEVLSIEYAEGARLYVPVNQSHLLSRYIGVGKKKPRLHRLGGKKWLRDKASAEEAVEDLAAHLLKTQAARAAEPGFAFDADNHWQQEFEDDFPYAETADQARAIQEVKEDMETARPMDRLVCGDVGYGKTEVAMRAAFKAVMNHRQVAMLVPTTILAQQHYDSFIERMQAFPVSIHMLSRFQSRAEQRDTLEKLKTGEVDIVIGTHRLIQPDVRFKSLGLVIIDEEQRFGVEQKEFLKRLRTSVDILTLTATPIPRTLYMSLTGARDMSTIQTPPQERLPIETSVTGDTDEVIREAVLRELNRDGQVFFLHNRVRSIEKVQRRIEKLVPEARVIYAHGQMPEKTLEDVMHRFIRHEYDVLVCTTIIESGVDIPNVNTILIDRADRFGMSALYQLRGRVGRFRHKAYAYLLIPGHGYIYDTARKRISAIKQYSSLGAGFKLALQDLEIRGAGNILGAEQSGHIATVGFDLYCQLLKRSVAIQKGEDVPPIVDVEMKIDFIDLTPGHAEASNAAVIPTSYIEDENQRVVAYRRIAGTSYLVEIDQVRDSFADRFGPVPGAFDRLLDMARIRVLAAGHEIDHVETREGKIMMMRKREYVRFDRKFPRLKSDDPGDQLQEIIALLKELPQDTAHESRRS